jgi:hypothetical protein
MNRRADKQPRDTGAVAKLCVICRRPADWWHHVAGRANARHVAVWTCREHADFLDAFLSLTGVKQKHNEPRTIAELVWAGIAGLDGLRAARDGNATLSPAALAAVRLIATHSADVPGPRPASTDARLSRRHRAAAATASVEAARARAAHDLLRALPGSAERLPQLLEMLEVFADPKVFERLERSDSEATNSLHASYEQTTIELLDAWRADEAGDPGAVAAVALAEQRFAQATLSICEAIASALNDGASSREGSTRT